LIKSQWNRAVVIGSSKRKFVVNGFENPGPGAYEARKVNDGPCYTLRMKNEAKPRYFVPVFFS
jgi:hypothetical protein